MAMEAVKIEKTQSSNHAEIDFSPVNPIIVPDLWKLIKWTFLFPQDEK